MATTMLFSTVGKVPIKYVWQKFTSNKFGRQMRNAVAKPSRAMSVAAKNIGSSQLL
jgi:hypothetical protein